MDAFLRRLSGNSKGGGHLSAKAAVLGVAIVGLLAIPVFGMSKEGRQGHDYFSHDKPEAIASGQDRLRKQQYQQDRTQSSPSPLQSHQEDAPKE